MFQTLNSQLSNTFHFLILTDNWGFSDILPRKKNFDKILSQTDMEFFQPDLPLNLLIVTSATLTLLSHLQNLLDIFNSFTNCTKILVYVIQFPVKAVSSQPSSAMAALPYNLCQQTNSFFSEYINKRRHTNVSKEKIWDFYKCYILKLQNNALKEQGNQITPINDCHI